jgi:hypothetical protein
MGRHTSKSKLFSLGVLLSLALSLVIVLPSKSQTPTPGTISVSNSDSPSSCNAFITTCQGPQVILTSANIINNDIITLVPAQGPNTMIRPSFFTFQYVAGTFPFGDWYNPIIALGSSGDICDANGIPNTSTIVSGLELIPCYGGISANPSLLKNQALVISDIHGPVPGGVITSATPTSGHLGLLYAVNDTGTFSGCGNTAAQYKVAAVSAGGLVSSVSILISGSAYITLGGCTTTVLTGSGNGTLNLDVVAANGNGSILVTTVYTVITVQ